MQVHVGPTVYPVILIACLLARFEAAALALPLSVDRTRNKMLLLPVHCPVASKVSTQLGNAPGYVQTHKQQEIPLQ